MSLEMTFICDCCKQPIECESVKYYDELYNEYLKLEKPLTARTKVWDTKSLFPHLCINCAGKIDRALEKFQNDINTLSKNSELNKQRREQLNSKG